MVFIFNIPFTAMLIPLTYSIKEPKRCKAIFKEGYVLNLFKVLKENLINKKNLKWVLIYSAVIFGFCQIALWFYQPYFILSGIDIFYFGFIFALFNVVAGISSKYAFKIKEKLGFRNSLIFLVLIVGFSHLLMVNVIFLLSFVFAFAHQFTRGFLRIIVTNYLNKHSESNIRATILSSQNMINQLFYASLLPIFGIIANTSGLILTLNILGILTLIIGLIVVFGLIKNKVV